MKKPPATDKAESRRFLRRAEEYWVAYLRRKRPEAARIKRELVAHVDRLARSGNDTVGHWLTLADLYIQRKPRWRCLHRALKLAPQDAEALAEMALSYARDRQTGKVKTCLRKTLRYAPGHPIEDMVLYTAIEAAKQAALHETADRITAIARERFRETRCFAPLRLVARNDGAAG